MGEPARGRSRSSALPGRAERPSTTTQSKTESFLRSNSIKPPVQGLLSLDCNAQQISCHLRVYTLFRVGNASIATSLWERAPGANSRETGNETTQTSVEFATTTGQFVRWLLGIRARWNNFLSF